MCSRKRDAVNGTKLYQKWYLQTWIKTTLGIVVLLLALGSLLWYNVSFSVAERQQHSVTFHGISMASASEGWAVGVTSQSPSYVLMQYHQQAWQFYRAPASQIDPTTTLAAVAMVSPSEGWAVGSVTVKDGIGFFDGGIILHYAHGQWTTDTILAQNTPLQAVTFRGPNDGWIAGFGGVILHYDGIHWQNVSPTSLDPLHMGFAFTSIVTNGADVWAAGYDVLLHFNGKTWTHLTLPNGAIANSLAIDESGLLWATLQFTSDVNPPLTGIWHFVGSQWVQQNQLLAVNLASIALDASGNGWAVGDNGTILHDAHGSWQRAQSPTTSPLTSIAIVSRNAAWAVGDLGTLLQYEHSAWNPVAFTQ